MGKFNPERLNHTPRIRLRVMGGLTGFILILAAALVHLHLFITGNYRCGVIQVTVMGLGSPIITIGQQVLANYYYPLSFFQVIAAIFYVLSTYAGEPALPATSRSHPV